ncbi:MAG TPA: hypothetical protein VFA18_19605 [Gemmataceae bacterium]|nr:hypothetical protein [Gemmataceae bacterium]
MPPQQTSLNAPPDERFWVRYSPHHEFRLSTLASLLLHLIVYGTAAFLISTVVLAKDKTGSVRIKVVKLTETGDGGAINSDAGHPLVQQKRTELGGAAVVQGATRPVVPNDPRVPQPRLREPEVNFPHARYVPNAAGNQIAQFEAIGRQRQPRNRGTSLGQTAHGPADGGSGGQGVPGNKKPSPQDQRLLRRVIKYDIGDGNLYRQELAGLGITLATPEKDAKGKTVYRVYRDLNHIPPKGRIEKPEAVRRTFWEDTNPETVRLLARALHIRPPSEFIAFLPPELEEDMLKKELAFKHVTDEKQIKKTVFAVVPTRGGYKVIVESQEFYAK